MARPKILGFSQRPKILEFRGERLSQREWSRRLGIRESVICNRLAKGWSVELALSEPKPPVRYDGFTLAELARRATVSLPLLRRRLRAGWPVHAAVNEPLTRRRKAKLITVSGLGSKPLDEWARARGLNKQTLRNRLRAGWTAEEAILLPAGPRPPSPRKQRPSAFPPKRKEID